MTAAIIERSSTKLEQIHRTRIAQNIRSAKSPNTERAYRAAWRCFVVWCEAQGLVAMPAEPATVAAFISDEAEQGKKPSTLGQRLAAIRHAHRLAGVDDPTGHVLVRETLKGIRRVQGVKPSRKAPVTVDRLSAMLAHVDRSTVAGKRDAALLLFGFASAMRRSELGALRFEDLELVPSGLLVTVQRSKSDQEGKGVEIGVPTGRRDELCPVRAIGEWISAAGIADGAVFRSVNRHDQAGASITGGAIGQLVKRLARSAGLKAADFGGHSLRAGFVTSAAENGANAAAIMEQTRHKSAAMVSIYTRRVDLWKGHAGDGLL